MTEDAYTEARRKFNHAALRATESNIEGLIAKGITPHSAATAILFGGIGATIEILGEVQTREILERFVAELKDHHDA